MHSACTAHAQRAVRTVRHSVWVTDINTDFEREGRRGSTYEKAAIALGNQRVKVATHLNKGR